MSFFDESSLCLIPSGYKNQKLYAVKPLSGDGDLTFSRASSATRVASNGLIEKVRTNQVLQSETLNNAYWQKINVSITANAIANPLNGATTADLLTVTDPSGPVEKTLITTASQAFTAGVPYTASAYFKAGSITTTFRILAFDGTTLYTGGTIDLATIGNSTAPYVSLGNGWYRFWFTFTPSSSTSSGFVYFVNYAFGIAANAGTNVYVYGAQIETGDIATAYIATTSAAVSVGPVSGLPRLDYLNSTCPRLLLEPQRTNSATYSEQFNNAAWTKEKVTITSNAIASPDGYVNADKIESTDTIGCYVYQTPSTGATYTHSVYAKAGNVSSFSILWASYSSGKAATFNLSNGTVSVVGSTVTATIVAVGNGWYRCTTTDTSANYIYLLSLNNATNTPITIGSFIYVYGAQVEAGAYATSYIPTLGTSVTRVADAASKTGISSLIGQTEGTLFLEISKEAVEDGARYMSIGVTGSGTNRLVIYQGSSVLNVYCGAGATFNLTYNPPAGRLKIAVAYKSGDYAWYVNGVQVATNTLAAVPTCSELNIGTNEITAAAQPAEVTYSQALLFKTRLSNSDLATLTTL